MLSAGPTDNIGSLAEEINDLLRDPNLVLKDVIYQHSCFGTNEEGFWSTYTALLTVEEPRAA